MCSGFEGDGAETLGKRTIPPKLGSDATWGSGTRTDRQAFKPVVAGNSLTSGEDSLPGRRGLKNHTRKPSQVLEYCCIAETQLLLHCEAVSRYQDICA
jgi:hypothetical protein